MASRRQWVALILSGIFPGLGHLYLRAWARGVGFLVAGLLVSWPLGSLLSLEALLAGSLPHPLLALGNLLALLAVFLWSLLDAWTTAGSGANRPPNR